MAQDDDDIRDKTRETEDDVLEEDTRPDDIFNPELDEEHLDEDYDTPAASPNPRDDDVIQTYPVTDDGVDRDELYNEGLREASGLSDFIIDSDNVPAKPLDPEE